MELLELAADTGSAELGLRTSDCSQFGVHTISLGRYDFLTEIHAFYQQHRKLLLRKGETLFHNYVGVVPRYHLDGAGERRERVWRRGRGEEAVTLTHCEISKRGNMAYLSRVGFGDCEVE
jgi:hypothetical protein